jgi:hypothetical protein
MTVSIGIGTTAVFGAAGSQFGSVLNLNGSSSPLVLNVGNFPQLKGYLPGLAWIAPAANARVEVTHDGGSSWWPVLSSPASYAGSGVWFLDGYTSRAVGAGNWSVVFLTGVAS